MIRKCRVCENDISEFMSLGNMPIANAFVDKKNEPNQYYYALNIGFCEKCFTLQILEIPKPEQMFNENYAYLSSTSNVMIKHFNDLADQIIAKKPLTKNSFIVEVGSNDGIFLKNFASKGLRHLGVDASKNVCELAEKKGVKVYNNFFNLETSNKIKETFGLADVIVSTNTMHHIEDINSVIEGMANLIKEDGIIITEDPSMLEMLKKNAYDQIYAEHMYIWSLSSMSYLFKKYGMEIYDIENNNLHGGCSRYFIAKRNKKKISSRVISQMKLEKRIGLNKLSTFKKFKKRIIALKGELKSILTKLKKRNKIIVGYGAPAKSTTILNFCDINFKLIDKIFDNTSTKIGKFTPGKSLIKIEDSKKFKNTFSDYCVLFAWNHKKEILSKEKHYSKQRGKWIIPVPKLKIV